MNFFRSIITYLHQTNTPLWATIVGFLGAFFLTSSMNYYLQNTARIDQHRTQEIYNLQEAIVNFNTFASAFSTELITDGKVQTETKVQLVENLNSQFARLEQIKGFLPEEVNPLADHYSNKISNMIQVVHKTDSVQTMKNFWAAASDLLVARNKLRPELLKAI